MKKLLTLLFILILATLTMLACDAGGTSGNCEDGHDFKTYNSNKDATCTEDGTKTAKCTRCDETDTVADEGSALGHNYSEWETVKFATCTEAGEKKQACKRCSAENTEAIAATGHDFADATCLAPKTCKNNCGTTEGEALGHQWGEYTSNNDATCTEDGNKTAKCVRCDKTNTVADEDTAKGHTFGEWETTTPATCTAVGSKTRVCSACGDSETEEIAAKGHDFADATCLAPKTCKNGCGETEGEALGHTFGEYVSNNDATCTADGTKTAKCVRCDKTNTVADEGSANGHSYGEWVETTPAKCNAKGEKTRTCSVCGDTDTEEIDEIDHSYTPNVWGYAGADGHAPKCNVCLTVAAVEPHTPGPEATEESAQTCTKCGYVINDKLEHTHLFNVEDIKEQAIVSAADCTNNAKYYYSCDCGAISTSDNEVFEAEDTKLGHSWNDATCTLAKKCSVCGTTEGEALGHQWGEYTSNNDATCTADGTKTRTCSVCNTPEKVTDEGSMTDHPFSEWEVTKTATCTVAGERVRECTKCDEKETEVIDATGHSWNDATCTLAKKCSVCGATEGEALGHQWGEYTSNNDATCTEDGTKSRVCVICGVTDPESITDEGSSKGHTYGEWHTTKPATCTTAGEKVRECTKCDAKETEVIDATGHSWNDATCTLAKKCSVCGATEGEALGHQWGEYTSNNDATCTEDGTKSRVCVICGVADPESITDEGSSKGHTYGEWHTTKPATCTVAGEKVRECTKCDAKETEVIEPAHSYSEATCITPATCKYCNETKGDKAAHKYDSWVIVIAPTEDTEGQRKRECNDCGHTETETIAPTDKPYGGGEDMDHGGWTPVN